MKGTRNMYECSWLFAAWIARASKGLTKSAASKMAKPAKPKIRVRDAERPFGQVSKVTAAECGDVLSFSEGSGFKFRDQKSDVRDQASRITHHAAASGLTSGASAHLTPQCK